VKHVSKSLVAVMALVLPLGGCKKQEKKQLPAPLAAAPADATHGAMAGMGMGAKKESTVVVPGNIKNKWKAVRIVVVEVGTKKETVHVVPVGSDFAIPGTGLTLRVENLIPSFTMGGGVITTKSEKLENPAAQVKIFEGGKESFKGWMFAKFPDTHAYQNSKYSLRLVEFVP